MGVSESVVVWEKMRDKMHKRGHLILSFRKISNRQHLRRAIFSRALLKKIRLFYLATKRVHLFVKYFVGTNLY